MKSKTTYPIALSIAGSDSCGGAGIQADLKTFSARGVYGATAITALTAQNTQGVHSQLAVPAEMVHDQIVAVLEDLQPSVVKIGMLCNVAIVHAVADVLSNYSLPIVLDPVMVSSSGHRLLSSDAQELLKQRLLPMASLLTPNIPEMTTLTGIDLSNDEAKTTAAKQLLTSGAKAILIKGGHEEGDRKSDILFSLSECGITSKTYTSESITTRNIHGTGCTLSAAIAAFIARGECLEQAIAKAKDYITEAIRTGAEVEIGKGIGPVNHNFNPQKSIIHVIK